MGQDNLNRSPDWTWDSDKNVFIRGKCKYRFIEEKYLIEKVHNVNRIDKLKKIECIQIHNKTKIVLLAYHNKMLFVKINEKPGTNVLVTPLKCNLPAEY